MGIKRAVVAACVLGLTVGPALAAPAGWKTYSNAGAGWSISYPANFAVNSRYKFDLMDPPIHGVSFAVPGSYTGGTNLDEGTLSVETLRGKNCKPEQFLSDPQDVKTVKADGRTYIAATGSDAGMSQYRDTSLFVIQGTCMAVRYFTHSTNAGVMDPPPKEFDAAKLTRLFDAMRATLTVKK